MRKTTLALACLALLVGACGQPSGESPNTGGPETTSTIESQPEPTTTAPPTTTSTTMTSRGWTVAAYGTRPSVVMGDRGELGSGCSPGTDSLPDGIWFGWIEEIGEDSISFDLACLWPGRLEPAASNDARRIRNLPLSHQLIWYSADGRRTLKPAANAPGLPDTLPYWIFINERTVTEVSEYPEPVLWARSGSAWPGLVPGCCDGGDVAPPSPADPLPDVGWPVDGFYKAWVVADEQNWIDLYDELYVINISKWLSCSDNPDLCPEWWVGAEVYAEYDGEELIRSVEFSPEVTVVIMPIFGESALVGTGVAFGELITDMNESVRGWVEIGADLVALSDSPVFPFGVVPGSGSTDQWEIGYRGPGGAHLTWFGGWLALEIRDGQPILYIHAGLIAG